MKTPNVQHIVDDVLDRFPGTSVGAWACRRIAGTLTWSQHSWTDGRWEGNAADVFAWRNGRPNMSLLDAVYGYLESAYPMTTAHTLWRVKNHYDHVHFDTWPQGFGKPPCQGGSLIVVNRDGSFSKHFHYSIEDDMPLTAEDKAWISGEISRQLQLVNSNLAKVPGKTWAFGDDPANPDDVSAWQYQIRTHKNTDAILKELT